METVSRRAAQAAETDDALVARAREGDHDAVDTLVARHLDAVFQVTLRTIGDRALAEDAAQEAWILALRGLPGFRGDASFKTWLLRIAFNAAHSTIRRRGRRRESALTSAEWVPDEGTDPEGETMLRAEGERVERVLEALPEKQRLAVSLRVYQGLSYREIGDIIDCSEASARVNYHHGIKRLRELVQ